MSGTDDIFRELDRGREKLFNLPVGAHAFLYPSVLMPPMPWSAFGVTQITLKVHVGQATSLCRDPPKVKYC